MLQILLGTDWVTLREEVLSRVASDVRQGLGGRILMVPELISHDTERRLCAAAGDTASRYAEVLSFTRLVRRVAEYEGVAAGSCMDNGGRVTAMAAAARQLHSRLKAYAAVETRPEFLTGLVDAVDEFKRCCITPRELMAASARAEGALAQKLEELSLLLEAYDGLCSNGKKDPRDQMNWLLEQLQDGDFAENHVFYIDGFPDLTRQHLAILEHLIRVSPMVTVAMNCDSVESGRMAFEKAGATAGELVRCAGRAGVDVRLCRVEPRQDTLRDVCGRLFQGPVPEKPVPGLQVWQAESVSCEVQAAAEHILALVRGGCRYRDIGVVCADMAGYQSVMNMVFHRCGIPLYQSGTEEILQKTVIASLLAALDAALGGLEQRDVLRYLKSVLSPLDMDTCDEIENYAIIWAVSGKRWEAEWTGHPAGLGENWTEESRQLLDRLNAARARAMEPLLRLRRHFKEAKNLGRQVRGLYAFLEEIGLARRLEELARELDAGGDNRSAQILDQLWEILMTAMEQMHDVLGGTVWEPEAFVRLFTLLLSQYDVGTIPPVLDAVIAGPVTAMRCQQVKHLLVLGAVEGMLPGYGGSAGLLTDQERVALRKLGVPLTGGALEGLQAEFAEIYGVFCGAGETVTVSYSGGQSSYVCRRLARMAGGEKRAAPVLGPALADPREAGAYLARLGDEAAAQRLGLAEWYSDTRCRAGHSLGRIAPDHVRALYGSTLNLSASQIDRQAECRMSYFLKYGMRAKECREATVDPAEFGTFVHAVLEKTASKVMELGGFHRVSLEKTLELAVEYAGEYQQEYFQQLDSQRLTYLFRRNRRELEMVVTELWQELKESRFQPREFELFFGAGGKMPAVEVAAGEMSASLRGFVDRVDLWEEDGCRYFRVVDYKTGKKDFDYCDVFNGVGLQMLLYLFALQRQGGALLGDGTAGAGVQYFPARAPLLAADGKLTDEQAEKARQKEWKRRGLLLRDDAVLEAMDPSGDMERLSAVRKKDGALSGDVADREQMKMLERYVFRVLERMVADIASGNVEPDPYTRGAAHDACAYCPYGDVCHRQEVPGRRNYQAMTAQRFWEEIEKEDRHG